MRHPRIDTPRASTVAERTAALTLALRAQCDERTAVRALREGPGVIRVIAVRERVADAMRALGLESTR